MTCLTMIVRDEAAIIEAAIKSAASLCDRFLIVDTGSSDDTPRIAREACERHGMYGEVVKRPWVDFAHNRTEALRLAAERNPFGHLFVLDADDRVEGRQYPFDADVGDVHKVSGTTGFDYPHLFSAKAILDGKVCYRGVTHEFVDIHPSLTRTKVAGVEIVCGGSGARRPRKHVEDIALLEAALTAGTDPDLEARYTFYLAQANYCAGSTINAAQHYRNRVALAGWPDEVFYSLLRLGELDDAQHYLRAADVCPTRPEPWCELAAHARAEEVRQAGWLYAQRAHELTQQEPHGLFADLDVWLWRADYELSIAAFYVGETTVGRAACDRILDAAVAPDWVLASTRTNRAFYK